MYGALGEIRTPDTQIRSLVLYPAELQAHGATVKHMAEREGFEPSIPVVPVYSLSRRAPSASRPSLLSLSEDFYLYTVLVLKASIV